jgi:glycine cleavage system aminomethyltransferase T
MAAEGESTIVAETGLGKYQVEARVGDAAFLIDEPVAFGFHWYPIEVDGRKVGDLTNYAFSYRLKQNIGFALIASACQPGSSVTVHKDGKAIRGTLQELPFI